MSTTFAQKKKHILSGLTVAAADYTDASPKGSVDEPIRSLVDEINEYNELVTTSSCSGRISVFLEGSGSGGKGDRAGVGAEPGVKGEWLFVTHDPLMSSSNGSTSWHEDFGLAPDQANEKLTALTSSTSAPRYVHFKFEPMIVHVACATAIAADKLLKCAQQAGFRESGASNVPAIADEPVNVAIRTNGLSFDCIVGFTTEAESATCRSCVSEDYLAMLVGNANGRFVANFARMERLRSSLSKAFGAQPGTSWEDADARKERKRREGLLRRDEMRKQNPPADGSNGDTLEDPEQEHAGLHMVIGR